MSDYVTHAEFQDFRHEVGERFVRIEARLDHTATKGDIAATKADIAETKAELIKWIVGTAIGLGVAAITVMTFVLNNATPKPPASAAQAPVIINIPAPASAPSAPPAQ